MRPAVASAWLRTFASLLGLPHAPFARAQNERKRCCRFCIRSWFTANEGKKQSSGHQALLLDFQRGFVNTKLTAFCGKRE